MKRLIQLLLAAALAAPFAHAETLINGAGSTFDYPALSKWSGAYAAIDPELKLNYQSIGSGGGIRQFMAGTVDFGATDGPLSDEMIAKSPLPPLHIPIVAGCEVMAYNLPGVAHLRLDGETIAGIYLGEITKWNDPKLAALNPGTALPDKSIVVVHRSDGSGTTYIFADYLSTVSSTWKTKVGKGTSVNWPVGLGGKGNEGVSGQVKQLPGAIGYVELAYALQNKMAYATLKNAAGNFVDGTLESTSAALATATIPDDFRFSMVNAPGETAYPIAGASWVLVYKQQKNTEAAHKLIAFLRWAVTDGQKVSGQLSYAPLPANLQSRVLKTLDTITYQ